MDLISSDEALGEAHPSGQMQGALGRKEAQGDSRESFLEEEPLTCQWEGDSHTRVSGRGHSDVCCARAQELERANSLDGLHCG